MDPLQSLSHVGIQIIEAPWMVDRRQVRFPRSKKKRIRRKWARDPRNWRMFPKTEIYEIQGGVVFMHPDVAAELRKRLRKAPDGPIVPASSPEPPKDFRQYGFDAHPFGSFPLPRPEPLRDAEAERNFRMFMDIPQVAISSRPFVVSCVP